MNNSSYVKIIGLRPPEVDLTLTGFEGIEEPISVVPKRALVPNLSLFYVSSIIKKELTQIGYNADISIRDMAASSPTSLSEYAGKFSQHAKVTYGNGMIHKQLRGISLTELRKESYSADVYFLSAQFAAGASSIAQTIHELKNYHPNALVIVGGRDAQYRSEWYLEQNADAVFLGQAEQVVGKTIDALLTGKPVDFPGVSTKYHKGSLGQRFIIDKSSLAERGVTAMKISSRVISRNSDLSQEHYPMFDENLIHLYTESCDGLLPKSVKSPTMWYTTSVGCPENCNFCPSASNPYYSLTIDRVQKIFEHYKNAKINTLLSAEDNFLARLKNPYRKENESEQELIQIMKLVRSYGFAHEFSNGLEVSLLMDDNNRIRYDLIENLFSHSYVDDALVGTYRMYWPIESLIDRNRLKKLADKEKHYAILNTVLQTNIPMIIFNAILFTDYGSKDIYLMQKELDEFCNWMHKHQRNTKWSIPIFHELPLAGSASYKKLSSQSFDISNHSELWAVPINPVNGTHYAYDELYSIKRTLMKQFDPVGLHEWDSAGRYGISKH